MGKNVMNITLHSGINADGIKVSILNEQETVFIKDYTYGWSLSHSRGSSDAHSPYVADLIKNLMEKYNIEFVDIETLPGIYVFSGKQMTNKETEKFKLKYLSELENK